MRRILFLLFLFTSLSGFSQVTQSFNSLKDFAKNQPPFPTDSSPFLSIYHNKQLHYLTGYYKAFQQEARLIREQGSADFYTDLAQTASFTGDYASVLALEKTGYDPLPDSLQEQKAAQTDLAKKAFYTDARAYILNRTRTAKVVMINEATNKPLHRAFTASLLEELYHQGFRYLAMETLDMYRAVSLRKLNMLTGHFTCEPVAGELVRKALELGFTLLPYEDTAYHHTANQREYTAAANIYEVLKRDTAAKIIVHAAYSHIEEGARSDSSIPMAAYFKIISGIDPLTIDQTEMTENSTTSYGAWVYDLWMQKHPVTGSVVPLIDNKPVDPYDFNLYEYLYNTPTYKVQQWQASMDDDERVKKEIPVQPGFQYSFLVQAYYDNEYTEKTVDQSVPADQTYNAGNDGYYYLYLHKGKYQIVFRDKSYKILGVKGIIVD